MSLPIRIIPAFALAVFLAASPSRAALIDYSLYASNNIAGTGTHGLAGSGIPAVTADMEALASNLDASPNTVDWGLWNGYRTYYEWDVDQAFNKSYVEQADWAAPVGALYVNATGDAINGNLFIVVEGDNYHSVDLYCVTNLPMNAIFLVFPDATGTLSFVDNYAPNDALPNILAPNATVELFNQPIEGAVWAKDIEQYGSSADYARPFAFDVPEPSSVALLALGAVGLMRRERE